VINFSVTLSGLQGKLLSLIISHFQPEIEREKQKLLESQERLKIDLAELEEKLLKELADSSGNILENK
jgi:dynein heavy chain 2